MQRKISINDNGYAEGKPEHSDLISRKVAYKEIYKKNRDKYPLKFRDYIVHHIDGDKLNNSVKNLYICIKEEHNALHNKQKERLKKFANSSAIDYFLRSRRAKGQTSLSEKEKDYSPSYDYYSERKEGIYNQKRERRARKIRVIIILIIVLFGLWQLSSYFNHNKSNNNLVISNPVPTKNIVVTSSKTEVIIKNNLQKNISVNVTYRIYSDWYGIDSQASRVFVVGANSQQTFKVYSNSGCDMGVGDCSVSIISYNYKGI